VNRDSFESEELVYVSTTDQWYPPSRCLWSSPVPVPDMVVIGSEYPEELRDFFLMRLKISPASLPTLVEALCSLSRSGSSLRCIKQMIKAINRKKPTQQDLEPLTTFNFLPIKRHTPPNNVTLGNLQETFAVVDNLKFLAIFEAHVDLLDFSLEEVHELTLFLQGLQMTNRYLSEIYTTQTACSGSAIIDERLTSDLRTRAYDILR
jgi:hypothetical protein